jgi:hypothetical protein
MERGPEAIRKYRFLNSFRPWWASMRRLPAEERPVDLGGTAALLGGLAAAGLVLLGAGLWRGLREEGVDERLSACRVAAL